MKVGGGRGSKTRDLGTLAGTRATPLRCSAEAPTVGRAGGAGVSRGASLVHGWSNGGGGRRAFAANRRGGPRPDVAGRPAAPVPLGSACGDRTHGGWERRRPRGRGGHARGAGRGNRSEDGL